MYCASSAPAPLIPPRLTETKAQPESSMTEQALQARAAVRAAFQFRSHVGVKGCPKRLLREALEGPGPLLGGSWEALGRLLEASKRHLRPETVLARVAKRFLEKN